MGRDPRTASLRVAIAAFSAGLVLATAGPSRVEAREEIRSFDVVLEVARDGSVRVTERIELRAGAETFRHGLVREIDTSRWRDHGVGWIQLPFRFREARLDGELTSHRETAVGGAFARSRVRVRAGPSFSLSPGTHRFELVWDTDRQTSYGPLVDELAWDVTGFAWPVPIASASVEVRVEGLAAPLELHATAGPRSGPARAVEAAWHPERGAVARTVAPLAPGEGLSLRIVLPKWSIRAPSYHRETEWFWLDWRGWIEAGWSVFVVSGVYLLMWLRVGVDRREGPLVVRYEPPDGLSAAAVGFLHHRGYHPRQYAAAVVALAVKGSLRIRRMGERWRLERGRGRGVLASDERAVLGALIGAAREVVLEPRSAPVLASGAQALRRALEIELERAFFVANRRWWFAGLAVSLAALGVLAWRWRFQVEAGASIVVGILAVATFVTTSLVVRAVGFLRHGRAGGGTEALVRGGLLSLVAALAAAGTWATARALLAMVPGHLVIASVTIGITNATFYHLLERPTRGGRAILARVEGFRRFLEAVDSDRLLRTGSDAATPHLFERHLPYAIALGIETRWASRFGALLTPPSFGVAPEAYRQDWYTTEGASGADPSAVVELGSELARALVPRAEPG